MSPAVSEKAPLPFAAGLLSDMIPEADLAAELRCTLRTMQRRRQLRIGPAYTIIGRQVFYQRDAVRQWLASLQVEMPRRRQERGSAR